MREDSVQHTTTVTHLDPVDVKHTAIVEEHDTERAAGAAMYTRFRKKTAGRRVTTVASSPSPASGSVCR
jgi:hypothetical protein